MKGKRCYQRISARKRLKKQDSEEEKEGARDQKGGKTVNNTLMAIHKNSQRAEVALHSLEKVLFGWLSWSQSSLHRVSLREELEPIVFQTVLRSPVPLC